MKKILQFIFPHRELFTHDYAGELHFQSSRVIFPASIISIFVWLNYIPIDRELFPDAEMIVFLRWGLTALAAVIFIIQFSHLMKKYSMWLLFLLGLYLVGATGLLTGLTAGDPAYMGGYLLVLIIPIIAPVRRYLIWIILSVSLVLFFSAGLASGMKFETVRELYKLNDLIAAAVFAFVFVYILDRQRFKSWVQSREIEKNRAGIERDKDRIDSIVNESRKLASGVADAAGVLSGSSREINSSLKSQVEIFSSNRGIYSRLIASLTKLKEESASQTGKNNAGREITEMLKSQLNEVAVNGKKAVGDAVKIKSLSDDCGSKLESAIRAIESLKQQSVRIEEISRTINDIADRTNLLSLNASIESARAGEHGRGFAVVADEISKLADNSISSSSEIGIIINSSVNGIGDAASQIRETSEALNQIIRFLESNSGFMVELGNLISEQETNINSIVGFLEDSLSFAQTIDSLVVSSTADINESMEMMRKIDDFFIRLRSMSDNLLGLSDNLAEGMGRMKNILAGEGDDGSSVQ